MLWFISPHSTSHLQPCDGVIFHSFKRCIQTQATTTLACSVLDGSSDDAVVNKSCWRQSWADWAARAVTDFCEKNQVWTTGWRRLRDDFRKAVEEAAALHARDELFAKHRARGC